MKAVILVMLLPLLAGAVSAQETKTPAPVTATSNALPASITIDGTTYEQVRWERVTPATVTIFHKTGVATLPLEKLPPELQKQFGYDAPRAADYRAAEALRLQQAAKEAAERRAKEQGEIDEGLQKLSEFDTTYQQEQRAKTEKAEASLKAFGGFTFKNVSTQPSPDERVIHFKGDIVNTTSNDWNVARFELNFYDTKGKKIACHGNAFTVYAIKRGEAQSINSGLGLNLSFLELSDQEFREAEERLSHAQWEFVGGEETAYYSFAMTSPKASNGLIFSDDETAASFKISSKEFAFAISNKTREPIKIDWNQVSYVDALGKAHKIIHEGVKYTDKGQPQPITTVPPGAFVNDVIIPVDSVYFSEGPGVWEVAPLFPGGQVAKTYEGATVSAFMPLEVNGTVKNYDFVFKITSVSF